MRFGIPLVLTALFGLAASPADAGTITAYSNISTFSGFALSNGSATSQSGNTITALIADDITPVSGLGGLGVVEFTFSVVNLNAVAVTARPGVRFYQSDGAGGGPGTLIRALTLGNVSFARATPVTVTATASPDTPLFTLPGGTFWAGLVFDDADGTTGATAAQLSSLGQGIYSPPTVGSSLDRIFRTSSAGSFDSSNPTGSLLTFGGAPVANFGWQFKVFQADPTAAPEPSTLASVAIAGLASAGNALRKRRAK